MANKVNVEEVSAPLSVSEIELDKELADRSFAEFVKMAWHVIEPGKELKWGWHLDAMCRHLQECYNGKLLKLLMTVPPGSTKSILVQIMFVAWVWSKNPTIRFLCCANESSLAVRDSVRCRRLIESEWYKERWGNKFKLTSDQNLKTVYENDKGGWRECTTTTSNVAGKKADFLILDDPQDAHKVQSELYRRETKDWWVDAFRNRVNDFIHSKRIVIGQRVHEDDLIAYILANENFVHIMLPEEFEISRRCRIAITDWEDPRTKEGELLRPLQYGPEQVEEYKKNPRYWATQHQQRPISRKGEMFKREWFDGKIAPRIPEGKCVRVRYWDKAGTQGGGDYTVGLLMCRCNGVFYVEDIVRGQWNDHEREDKILFTAGLDREKYGNSVRTVIEVDPGTGGKESGQTTLRNLAGFSVELNPIARKGDKESRAVGFCDQCGGGNVYLIKAPWNELYLDEICSFPWGTNDDQVDCSSGAFNKLVKIQSNFHSSPLYLFPSPIKNKNEDEQPKIPDHIDIGWGVEIPIDEEQQDNGPRRWWEPTPRTYANELKKRFPWLG